MARWTEEEDNRLKELRESGVQVKDIELPGRSPAAIRARCAKVAKKYPRHTEEDIAKAIEEYEAGVPVKNLSIGYNNIRDRLETKRITKNYWTKEDIELVISMRDTHTQQQIADKLGRPVSSVSAKVSALIRDGYIEAKQSKPNFWSEEEIEDLRNLIESGLTHIIIAGMLGRTKQSVAAKASRLGIKSQRIFNGTKVYLVYFPKHDFYKIGITAHSVESRLTGFPAYEVIEVLNFADRSTALKVENYFLTKVVKYIPNCLPNGHTECFKSRRLENFDQLLKSFTEGRD